VLPRTLIYQIFVDRFAAADGRALGTLPPGVEPWMFHAGGTLDGIVARLDHVVSLGADAIYLTPIFTAPSNHKYDTATFDEVDPRFGGGAAFDRLAAACRARGLGLLLDGVFNHVGEEHPWFTRARADAGSREASWFRFSKHPGEYARWRGYGHLPEVDLAHPDVTSRLFDAKDSIVRRWIERGATGWRLDCANDLGIAACRRIAAVARDAGASDGAVGEIMSFADVWLAEGGLDGVMNYWFRESVLGLCRGEVPAVQAAANLEQMARRYPPAGLRRSWNMLSSHDTPRLATQVTDPAARALARTLAFVTPGVPLVYYGEEIGMRGGPDPDNRAAMAWDESGWDRDALAHIRRLAGLRRSRRALREGEYLAMPQPGAPSLLAFARTTGRPEETLLVIANGSASRVRARVFAPHAFLFDSLPLADLLAGDGTAAPAAPIAKMEGGRVDLDLAPWAISVLAPMDGTIPGYNFFKPY
jgi:glycosidase